MAAFIPTLYEICYNIFSIRNNQKFYHQSAQLYTVRMLMKDHFIQTSGQKFICESFDL